MDNNNNHELIKEIYSRKIGFKEIKNPDFEVSEKNTTCGDEFEISVVFENKRIKDVGIKGNGCVISTVSFSLVSEWIKGKKIDDIKEKKIKKELFEFLGFDEHNNPIRAKCAKMAIKSIAKLKQKVNNIYKE